MEPYLIEKLISKSYDYILVPMTNNHLEGYRNVLKVAQLIEPKVILGVYPEGNVLTVRKEQETIKASV